jgi:hypothetical protein
MMDGSPLEASTESDAARAIDANDAATIEDARSRDSTFDDGEPPGEHGDSGVDDGESSADAADSMTENGDSAPPEAGDSGSAPDAYDYDALGNDASDAEIADALDATAEPDATDSAVPDAALADGSANDAGDSSLEAGDAGSPFDASGIDATSLCAPFLFDAPQIRITYVDAAAPSPSTFVGGAIESGTYWLTSVTSYQGAFGNASTTAEIMIIDAVNKTIRNAYADIAPPATYSGFGYVPNDPSPNSFLAVVLCPSSGATEPVYYSFSGTGPGAHLTFLNGASVNILTKQ